MKNILIFLHLLFFLLFYYNTLSYNEHNPYDTADKEFSPTNIDSVSNIAADTINIKKIRILLANVNVGNWAKEVTEIKVDAALALATAVTGKYEAVSIAERDSVASILRSQNIAPTVDTIAKILAVDKLLFVAVNRIENMLRIDIETISVNDTSRKSSGYGYGLLHFHKEKDSKPLYDPTLLEALQRAFAVCEKDSMMYSATSGKFRVFPMATLVIGGLEYRDNDSLFKWELFEKKVVSSYDAVETIFEEAIESSDYVVYDIPTRDTIFALFNLYIIENYNHPSINEISALRQFDVKFYITGILTRNRNGADIELFLCSIIGDKIKVINSVNGKLEEDNQEKYRSILKELTQKLLKTKK